MTKLLLDKHSKFDKLKFWLPSILLFVLYLSESYFKILVFSNLEHTIITKSFKALLLIYFSISIFFKRKEALVLPSILFLLFTINQLFTVNGFKAEIYIYTSKYFYLLLTLIFFNIHSITNFQRKYLFFVFEKLLLLNSIIIFIGFLFNIEIFNTYSGNRFGYNGLLITSSTGSYVYIITIIYFYIKYKKKYFYKIENYIVLIAALLVGTKAIYTFLFVFFVFYTWKYLKFNRNIILITLFILFFIGTYVLFFEYGIFNSIREKEGLLSSIMSYRNILLSEKTLPYIKENWSFINYLFGGINNLSIKSQLDIIDLFCFFGVIGTPLFLYIFYKNFFLFRLNLSLKILLSTLLFNVILAGNFFSYASIVIYLVILKEQLVYNDNAQ